MAPLVLRTRVPLFAGVLLSFAIALPSAGQTPPPVQSPPATAQTPADKPPTPPPADKNQPEMATKEAPATFKTRVNLVMVPVVVRDNKGHAIGTLRQEDFQLFDRGKPQIIAKFSMEKSGPKGVTEVPPTTAAPPIPTEDQPMPPDIPERFIAYLFDDQHLKFGDLARVRDAAGRHLGTLQKTDRAAIYTTSGHNQLEFTDDRDQLDQALMRLRPQSITDMGGIVQCPDISYYMADMMVNRQDATAIGLAQQEVMNCSGMDASMAAQARSIALGRAYQVLPMNTQETRVSLITLKDVVRRMSGMPGQRIVVLVSPGFLTLQEKQDEADVLDRAVRGNVIINSLDARGLWVDPMVDVSRVNTSTTPAFLSLKLQYDHESAMAQSDVLADMAAGTGGTFFQNSNDLEEGLRRLATAPEYLYLLGFSPQNLKLDGSFHALKVTLKPSAGLSLLARRGYYAPKKLSDAAENAKQEIEEALFSREEMHDLPVELHTQFFKTSDKDATLTVRCRMDPKHIQFRKADGRNYNTLTIVSGVFDRNGNMMSGITKTVELRLKDETLARLMTSGMAINTSFSVAPGTYMIRLVVRDSEGQLMSAANGAVAIP